MAPKNVDVDVPKKTLTEVHIINGENFSKNKFPEKKEKLINFAGGK